MNSASKQAEAMNDVPVQAGRFYDIRHLDNGRVAGVEPIAEGYAQIVIERGGRIEKSWGYPSITGALEAWFAWAATKSEEPTGWDRRDPA